MLELSRRAQVLLTDAQYARLKNQARLRHESVGAVIRQAIEEHLGDAEQADRLAAVSNWQLCSSRLLTGSRWNASLCQVAMSV
jgi:hypothetical protein